MEQGWDFNALQITLFVKKYKIIISVYEYRWRAWYGEVKGLAWIFQKG